MQATRASAHVEGMRADVFARLPAHIALDEHISRKRVKREHEHGVHAGLRFHPEPFDESWLRNAYEVWLRPREQAVDNDGPRGTRGLGSGSRQLMPLAIASCKVDGSATILVKAINELIGAADWHELALVLRQVELWHSSVHRADAERPWWELMAAESSTQDDTRSQEFVDLASRELPGGCDAPLIVDSGDIVLTGVEVKPTMMPTTIAAPLPAASSSTEQSSSSRTEHTEQADVAIEVHHGAVLGASPPTSNCELAVAAADEDVAYVLRGRATTGGKAHNLGASEHATLRMVIEAAFRHFLSSEWGETIDAHLWDVYVRTGDWQRKYSGHVHDMGSEDSMSSDGYFDDYFDDDDRSHGTCESVQLKELRPAVGDQLRLVYDYGSNRSLILSVVRKEAFRADNDDHGDRDDAAAVRYIGPQPDPPNGALLTDAEKAESAARRTKFATYLAGDNYWSWAQGKYIKPQAPNWSPSELGALNCLISELAMPFSKAWSEFLEPCFIIRSKSATTAKWYSYKKLCSSYTSTKNRDASLQRLKQYVVEVREEQLLLPCDKQPPVLDWGLMRVLEERMVRELGDFTGEGGKRVQAKLKAMSSAEKFAKFMELDKVAARSWFER